MFEGDDLTCVRAGRIVFGDLGFRLFAGGACLVTGRNGSGKSSLLRLMAGLIRPAAGEVRFRGEPIRASEAFPSEMHFVGHLDSVKPALSVSENLRFWAQLHGGDAVSRGLDWFGIGHLADAPARLLSAGQRRRLALARLIAAPGTLWLLDEPTIALRRERRRCARSGDGRASRGGGCDRSLQQRPGHATRGDAPVRRILCARSRGYRVLRQALRVIGRDLLLARRRSGEAGLAVIFFVLAGVLFPLGIGPETTLLARAAGGLLWVTALLAVLLSLDRLFQADWEDGSLDLLLLAPLPLSFVVLAKCIAHWLLTGLPLVAISPVLGLLLNLPPAAIGPLALSMLLGTPTLTLIGALGAALTLGARRGGMLMTLLVLPLYIPVLIFGAGAVDIAGPGARPHLLILGAFFLAALALVPWAASAALREALD